MKLTNITWWCKVAIKLSSDSNAGDDSPTEERFMHGANRMLFFYLCVKIFRQHSLNLIPIWIIRSPTVSRLGVDLHLVWGFFMFLKVFCCIFHFLFFFELKCWIWPFLFLHPNYANSWRIKKTSSRFTRHWIRITMNQNISCITKNVPGSQIRPTAKGKIAIDMTNYSKTMKRNWDTKRFGFHQWQAKNDIGRTSPLYSILLIVTSVWPNKMFRVKALVSTRRSIHRHRVGQSTQLKINQHQIHGAKRNPINTNRLEII